MTFFRSKASIAGSSILGLLLLVVLGINLLDYSFCCGLDELDGQRAWPSMATLMGSGESSGAAYCNIPFFNLFAFSTPAEVAAQFYLKAYLYSIAGKDRLAQARICMARGDKLTEKSPQSFKNAISSLNTRALACEYVLHLPHLAEFCQRCAVAQCRRQADLAAKSKSADTAYFYLLLAEQTSYLGQIFARHQKFEIAERAYQDAVISSSISAHMEDLYAPGDKKSDPSPRFYYLYADYLSELEREEQALVVLEKLYFRR